jgi:hypothetical protein
MAKNEIGPAPFSPVYVIDQDAPLTAVQLARILNERPAGISFCVRYEAGPEGRGGYFFHVQRTGQEHEWTLFDFEKHPIAEMGEDFLCRFVNHCSGRIFDEDCFDFARNKINLRSD